MLTQEMPQQEVETAKILALDYLVQAVVRQAKEDGSKGVSAEVQELNGYLSQVREQSGGGYDMLLVTDATGHAIADSLGGQLGEKGYTVGERDYFFTAKKGETNIGAPVKSMVHGKPVVVVAVPLKGSSGTFGGILAAASSQVAAAGQSLAEGSSEQAARLHPLKKHQLHWRRCHP